MEGEGVTDPEFLDDPATTIPGASGAIRLDNREKLVDDGSWHQPEALTRSGDPCINDLATHRWHGRFLNPDQEIDAVSRIQAADICGPLRSNFRGFEVFTELLAPFHWQILTIANGHMPRYWRARRWSLRDKHTNNLLFEDLVAAGVAAMWKATLKFDLAAGYRFWTATRMPVLGAISDEARIWRRHGSGEGRLGRWLYSHPDVLPEQILRVQQRLVKRPVFHSLQEAAEGIKQFWAWGSEFDYSIETDESFEPTGTFFAGMYSCFNRYTLSPQLRYHEPFSLLVDRLSGGLDTGPDVGNASKQASPHDILDYTETTVIQFKNGKRQVTRQKAASYCYGIVVSPELRVTAQKNLEFAKRRWECRTKRASLPAKTYPRWSTMWLNHNRVGQGKLGRLEHESAAAAR